MPDRVARLGFLLGVAFFVYLAGVVTGWRQLPPANYLDSSADAARDWGSNWRSYLGLEPVKSLHPARGPGAGVVVHDPERTQPGVTLLTGLWGSEMGLSLRAMDGRELHRWRAVFGEVWPDAAHLPREAAPANDWDATLHGALLLPGGDVVFNFDAMGMVRLDRCGEVVWRLPLMTHHSVALDERGHFWVPKRRLVRGDEAARFPGLKPPFLEDSVLEVSADGQVLREISLLGAIYGSRYEGVLFANGMAATSLVSDDPLHANHVELLPSALAGAFPQFEAGDILVSMRNVNLVMVLDGETARVKWSRNGPWVRQHDPHFLPDGQIAVYDNRRFPSARPGEDGVPAFASRILAVDPQTDRITVLHEGTLEQPFYADSQGKHQFLPNGNILVTEPRAGRAFEVTAAGEIVWEFVNRYDGDRVANLSQATRYPPADGAFAARPCPAPEPR